LLNLGQINSQNHGFWADFDYKLKEPKSRFDILDTFLYIRLKYKIILKLWLISFPFL